MIRSLLNLALRPLFSFAESKFAEAEGCDRETVEALALGGADISLPQQLRGHTVGTRPTHEEFFALHHGWREYQ